MVQELKYCRAAPAVLFAIAALAQAPRGAIQVSADTQSFLSQPKVALVVGIDNYPKDSEFASLRFAAADARDLSRRLAGEGYRTETLINEKAAGKNIIKKLDDLLRGLKGSQGTVVFAFSGHGGQVKDSQYLALTDTRLALLEETGLPLADVRKMLESSQAPRKVMFIDACRSEPTKGVRGPGSAAEAFGDLGTSRGIAILNATEPKPISFEDPKLGHGVFTSFLLRGLEGEAAGPTGLITFDNLRDYVTREMDSYSHSTGHRQLPHQTVDGVGDFYLAGKWKSEGKPTMNSTTDGKAAASLAADLSQREVALLQTIRLEVEAMAESKNEALGSPQLFQLRELAHLAETSPARMKDGIYIILETNAFSPSQTQRGGILPLMIADALSGTISRHEKGRLFLVEQLTNDGSGISSDTLRHPLLPTILEDLALSASELERFRQLKIKSGALEKH